MASITNLEAFAEAINAQPSPADRFCVTISRATRDWMLSDLKKRTDRLLQAVSNPHTKENRRLKKHKEVILLQQAITALTEKAKLI